MALRFDSPADGLDFILDLQVNRWVGSGALAAQAAGVSGSGSKSSSATITLAGTQLLRSVESGQPKLNKTLNWEFYNDPTTTAGLPADTGQVTTDAVTGEVTINITTGVTLSDGEYGMLVLYSLDPNIGGRGVYRLPVEM